MSSLICQVRFPLNANPMGVHPLYRRPAFETFPPAIRFSPINDDPRRLIECLQSSKKNSTILLLFTDFGLGVAGGRGPSSEATPMAERCRFGVLLPTVSILYP